MSEHRIRLRGGWDCHYREGGLEDSPEIVRRIDLPMKWLSDLPTQFRLTRQFGKPPVDMRFEEVSLEMKNVHGLNSVRLNGHVLTRGPDDTGFWSVSLTEPLLPRNGVVLEVVLDQRHNATPFQGDISLLIRPR